MPQHGARRHDGNSDSDEQENFNRVFSSETTDNCDDSEESCDEPGNKKHTFEGQSSNNSHRQDLLALAMPGDGASIAELRKALQATQLHLHEIRNDNRRLKRDNALLKAKQPTRARASAVPKEVIAHDEEIGKLAKKYGIMVDMSWTLQNAMHQHLRKSRRKLENCMNSFPSTSIV
ncbi:hypothetical protein SERLADRAFT_438867 [Serpula lacrymans var. lacrymans S7.9]|uniref:Uncharacterized protein n=1 Tax=Serpula lacrymans var. lacrymans (strain S7.9) TaxID=578457 RepID=F8P0J5_SERL9|nr:uncharacterized protein SERLADRAFT_438867 [Serpula lacrymans var. lacrymans S7.9]EGO23550.1 hypothetical protein SERLADRAFT_438867 [Serpula lacrymans var. lacrymans S7.9]